jgi:hypothetical protein
MPAKTYYCIGPFESPTDDVISGIGRSTGRAIPPVGLNHLYARYKNYYFPKLLDSPNIPPEDKLKIKELLKKPWNPYLVGRHTSLTQKSRILKEPTLRMFAGWSANSDMPRRYIHLFGNAACEDLLQAYGLVDKEKQAFNGLQSKQCPNCSEPNKPDSKFCAKCRMVLTYDAYSETMQENQDKENELHSFKERMDNLEKILVTIQPLLQYVKPEILSKLQLVEKQ